MEAENAELNLIEQRVHCLYSKLHILHSRYFQLYRAYEPSAFLSHEVATLSHSKRKKPNQKLVNMQFMKDFKTVILGYDKASERGDINFIDVAQPKINDFYYNKLQGGLGGIVYFEDGRHLVVADKKGCFAWVDMFKGPNIDDIRENTIITPHEGVLDITLAPSEQLVACGLTKKQCIVLDLVKERTKKLMPLQKTFSKHAYGVNSINWHPFKSLIVSSSYDLNDTVKLWDPHSEELISEVNFHRNSIVTKCKFHPSGNTYFSFGKDNSVIEYQIRFKGIFNRFQLGSEPTALEVVNDGTILVGDSAGYLHWFGRRGDHCMSEKGVSGIVLMTCDESKNLLVVARERDHLFQIYTSKQLLELTL